MATLRFYLDVRRPRKSDGKSQLQFQINHGGKTALVPLGVYLLPEGWDAHVQRVTGDTPAHKRMDILLREWRLEADIALLDMATGGRDAKGVAEVATRVLFPDRVKKEEPKRVTVLEAARRLMGLKTGRSTKESYRYLCWHLERFRPEATLDEVGREWLTGLTQNYPFRKFKIKNGEDEEAGAPGGGVASVAPGA
ncbi:MAG: hypothetical protein LIO91_02655 [Bacteroidales bacterium]|nr:hypothetical protein [Bacteroidales bacterium]